MANPLRGEALAKLKDGRELTLCMDFDAWCAIEDLTGLRTNEILGEMAYFDEGRRLFRQPTLKAQRGLLYGATRRHHPEISTEECASLVTLNNAEILWPLLGAVAVSLGRENELAEDETGGDGEAGEGPIKAGLGIGAHFSTDGAPQDSSPAISAAKRQIVSQEH